jgi:hypothetical protein
VVATRIDAEILMGITTSTMPKKPFEVGENSSLGIVTWGLGGLAVSSYRMLIAQLADGFVSAPPSSVAEVAQCWCDHFWNAYSTAAFLADGDKHRA